MCCLLVWTAACYSVPLHGADPAWRACCWASRLTCISQIKATYEAVCAGVFSFVAQVRVAITSQLHIMAKQVAPSDAARLLRRPLAALLRDSSPQVREGLLAGLAETLQVRMEENKLRLSAEALQKLAAHRSRALRWASS